jgi:hypothetical protein
MCSIQQLLLFESLRALTLRYRLSLSKKLAPFVELRGFAFHDALSPASVGLRYSIGQKKGINLDFATQTKPLTPLSLYKENIAKCFIISPEPTS